MSILPKRITGESKMQKKPKREASPQPKQGNKKVNKIEESKKNGGAPKWHVVKDLLGEILTGSLILADKKDFKLPLEPLDQFNSKLEYVEYWRPLYKYEIYNRLFSDKDLGQNDDEDAEPQDGGNYTRSQ